MMPKIGLVLYALVVGTAATGAAGIAQSVTGDDGWGVGPIVAFIAVTLAGGVFADDIFQLHRDALQQWRQRRG